MIRHQVKWLLAVFPLLVIGCSNNSGVYPSLAGSDYVGGLQSFTTLQTSIFIPYCENCHMNSISGQGRFGVDSYVDVVETGYVVPGNSAGSPLCTILETGHEGINVSAASEICNWIQDGAPN